VLSMSAALQLEPAPSGAI